MIKKGVCVFTVKIVYRKQVAVNSGTQKVNYELK